MSQQDVLADAAATLDEALAVGQEPDMSQLTDDLGQEVASAEPAAADFGATDLEPEAIEPAAVAQVGLPLLGQGTPLGEGRDLRLLADIQVELSVVLGRSRLPLRTLLSLAPGAVLELDRAAGEPVDVLVNGKVVARGEVVVVDGDFGVRINEIASDT
jgi:flagellar motor switch protein FliN